jgi:uncharacterized protein (DUF1501 family)
MSPDRRSFLRLASLAPFAAAWPALARAAASDAPRLLVLVELKGGNDGLNTVIPYADAHYAELRPRLAIARDQVVQLDERTGLHPSLAALKPLWDARRLAIVQGVGYAQPNLSHFRSIEIWDTASRSDEYLDSGWVARAFARSPRPPRVSRSCTFRSAASTRTRTSSAPMPRCCASWRRAWRRCAARSRKSGAGTRRWSPPIRSSGGARART